uniref:Uncharacterized protein n=1 Tax=Parascaris univalens TaxID=6257 RepID=A0A914ZUZ5_PARUN
MSEKTRAFQGGNVKLYLGENCEVRTRHNKRITASMSSSFNIPNDNIIVVFCADMRDFGDTMKVKNNIKKPLYMSFRCNQIIFSAYRIQTRYSSMWMRTILLHSFIPMGWLLQVGRMCIALEEITSS